MKLILINHDGKYMVQQEAVTLNEILPLVKQLLLAAGFYFNGEVCIEDDEAVEE